MCIRDRADTLRWVLAEVRNTPWNERHYYAVDGQQARPLEKAFHVSPFNPMDMVYHWRFNAPGKTLHMHIENHQASKVFDATLALSRVPLTLSLIHIWCGSEWRSPSPSPG